MLKMNMQRTFSFILVTKMIRYLEDTKNKNGNEKHNLQIPFLRSERDWQSICATTYN